MCSNRQAICMPHKADLILTYWCLCQECRVGWLIRNAMLAALKLIHRFVSDISCPCGAVPNTLLCHASVSHVAKYSEKAAWPTLWQHKQTKCLASHPAPTGSKDKPQWSRLLNHDVVLNCNMVPIKVWAVSSVNKPSILLSSNPLKLAQYMNLWVTLNMARY